MKLKELLPKPVYEAQKKLFASIIKGGKRELKRVADDIYIIQKDVFADMQKELVTAAVSKARLLYTEYFDQFCEIVAKKVPFIGKIIASILKKYKNEIIEAIL